ncbi:alpha/beta hydrolase-fold protein [Eudoraea adriatica]|uniref:alpha/beta hydrolase-fold protein n=1 Tax=Eudoraea adriatica TaxID=446681 RepID=UPI000367CBC3|nr:alpha/beta hydrolase-fold protein [Eudoraea adriatica]
MNYKTIKISFAALVITFFQFSVNAQLADKIALTEDNQLLGLGTQHILKSEILQKDRPIIISLPIGYENNKDTYPVLYLLDGLGNIKHQVGTVELLTESGVIPPMIIVAIESLDRAKDLTPSNAGADAYAGANTDIPQSGGASNFLEFLERELIPYVESNFRTHPYRLLEGHSFGGLFCTYALMNKPELFDAFIIQAPALWWNKEEMTGQAKEFFKSNVSLDKAVYFGTGGAEGWGMRQELLRYVDVIKQNTPKNFRWKHEEIPGDEEHDDSRLLLNYYGLKFVFSDLKASEDLQKNYSDEAFLKGEQELIEKYGQNARRPASDYGGIIMELLNTENNLGAITVYKRAAEAYPKYIMFLNTLATLYEKTNQIDKAIETYKSAIEVSNKLKLGNEEGYQKEIERLEKT